MTPQELKNSILQLAMQGKLVPQSANEECVSVASSFIGEVSDLYEIPENWKWLALKDVANIVTGLSFKKQDQKDSSTGSLRILRGGNIGDDYKYHLYDDDIYVDLTQFQDKYVSLLKGDIITPSVTSMEKICKTGYIDKNLTAVTAGGFVYIIRCLDAAVIDSKFLLYFISSSFNKEQCKPNIHKSGQAFYNLKKSGFIDQPVCVPPLAEQHRIVAKIEELLPLIDRYEKAYTRLEDFNKRFPVDMQKSILQMAIQGKLVEQRAEEGTGEELYQQIQAEKAKLIKAGKIKKEKPLPDITEDEIPFEIPDTWKWVRLTVAALTIVDCPHSTPVYYDDETGYYAIGTKCLNEKGTINFLFNIDQPTYEKRTERLIPQNGDIVYSREGSIVCRAVILPKGKKIALGQRVMLIRCPYGINNRYLQLFLMAENTVKELTKNYKGVGVKHINVADVCALPIPLPPLAEQKRIVDKLEEILPLCDRLK